MAPEASTCINGGKCGIGGYCKDCHQPGAKPVVWVNSCDRTVPEALRFLAKNPRPNGGQDRFNEEHLLQLADEMERSAAAPQPEAKPVEPVSKMVDTAPENIWLQVSDEPEHMDEEFPYGEEVTWCSESCVSCEVKYIRVDLATPPDAAARIAELEAEIARLNAIYDSIENIALPAMFTMNEHKGRPLLDRLVQFYEETIGLREQQKLLVEALDEAIDSIEDWAAYAGEYFTKKHKLQEELARRREVLATVKGEKR